ncbi:hypothetical protein R5P06_03945 [Candidatus Thioglobus autotrophicus]|uniref:toxin-antitoxin system YwqK family antitoxin n=1 Tax=Candidatus Thioglobus autotrophicus TaxID=1705394 RepID=UPI00299DF2A4|nr:hypothetical protein [Candidatus Thioglobus autotrophicus]WPE17226.1 hypothetical protein R5P06_03945 [Candidatus Thioglobus autotrophicus]
MGNLKATTYPNGNFKSQSMCNKDKTDDFRVQWYESGHMKSAGEYKHRKRDGLHTSWHENGQKSAEINYNQGIKDGQITLWYKDGSKRLETSYSNGRISGLCASWYESGQIQKAVIFKNQKKVSKAYWYGDGQIKIQADYESDYRICHELPEIDWDSQPYKDIMNEPFTLDSKPEDVKTNPYFVNKIREASWYENGVIKQEWGSYRYCSVSAEWYKNGQLKRSYDNSATADGTILWHENGQLSYKFKSSTDEYTSWNANGIKEYELDTKYTFDDDGFWRQKYIFFNEKNEKLCTIKQKDDESICYWFFYDSDDNKAYEYYYDYAEGSLTGGALWQFWIDQNISKLTNILIPIKAHKALFYNPIFIYD